MNNIQFNAVGTAIAMAATAFAFSFQFGIFACLGITVAAAALTYIATYRWEKRKQNQDAANH